MMVLSVVGALLLLEIGTGASIVSSLVSDQVRNVVALASGAGILWALWA